jgi:hypothetical protein
VPTRIGGLREFNAGAQNINIILPIKTLYIGLSIKKSSSHHYGPMINFKNTLKYNKTFWEELICLLSLHKLTVNNTVAMFTIEHKDSRPTAKQGSHNEYEHQYF